MFEQRLCCDVGGRYVLDGLIRLECSTANAVVAFACRGIEVKTPRCYRLAVNYFFVPRRSLFSLLCSRVTLEYFFCLFERYFERVSNCFFCLFLAFFFLASHSRGRGTIWRALFSVLL